MAHQAALRTFLDSTVVLALGDRILELGPQILAHTASRKSPSPISSSTALTAALKKASAYVLPRTF